MEDRQQLGVHAFAFNRVISFFITLRSPMSLVLVTLAIFLCQELRATLLRHGAESRGEWHPVCW